MLTARCLLLGGEKQTRSGMSTVDVCGHRRSRSRNVAVADALTMRWRRMMLNQDYRGDQNRSFRGGAQKPAAATAPCMASGRSRLCTPDVEEMTCSRWRRDANRDDKPLPRMREMGLQNAPKGPESPMLRGLASRKLPLQLLNESVYKRHL